MKKYLHVLFLFWGPVLLARELNDTLKHWQFSAAITVNKTYFQDEFFHSAYKSLLYPGVEVSATYNWGTSWRFRTSFGYLAGGFIAKRFSGDLDYRINQQFRLFYFNPSLILLDKRWRLGAGLNIPLHLKSFYTYDIYQYRRKIYENTSGGGLVRENYRIPGLTADIGYALQPRISVFVRVCSYSISFYQVLFGLRYRFHSL